MPLSSAHWYIWQWSVDHIYQKGEKTQLLPPEKHPQYPRHILARQSVQHQGPVLSQPSKHVHPAQTAQAVLAGSCLPHGGWLHPKRLFMESWHLERRTNGHSQLHYKDVSKRDMKALGINRRSPGRTLQLTTWCGEALWTNTSSQGKRSWWRQK